MKKTASKSYIRLLFLVLLVSAGIMLTSCVPERKSENGDLEFNGPYKSWLNVRDFGAVGDGKHDDSTAIDKALAELASDKDKGVLYFPSGIYRITHTIEFVSSNPQIYPPQKGVLGKSIIGQSPETTVIKWGGAEAGEMIHLAGQSHCDYARLTLDGNNKASICLRIERNPKLFKNSSYDQIRDIVFQNAEYGIYNTDRDNKHDMDAEYSILRCTFKNCSKSGIRVDAGNAYDYWIRHCKFIDCTRGVENTYGDFYVMQSVFLRSKDADIVANNHRAGAIRDNYSRGSRQFIRMSQGRFVVQNNRIIEPTAPDTIYYERKWRHLHVLILDNKIRSTRLPAGSSLIRIKTDLDQPNAIIGNQITLADSIVADHPGALVFDNETIPAREISTEEPPLPRIPPQIERKVFDAAGAHKLQEKIDEAVAFEKENPGSRPVIHLEPSDDRMDQSIVVPANVNMKIVGDGQCSTIRWKSGASSVKPAILLRGPSRITIQNLFLRYFMAGPDKNIPISPIADVLIDNADQPGARVIVDNSWIAGVFADGLKNTHVDLLDYYSSNYGGYLWTTLKVTGPDSLPASSRVGMFGGVAIGDQIHAHVLDGGRLIMQDFWHEENAPMTYPWALVQGRGIQPAELTIQSAFLYQHGKNPLIRTEGMSGHLSLVGNFVLGGTQDILLADPVEKTSFLSLFGCVQLSKRSARPDKMCMLDKVGSTPGEPDKDLIRENLAFLRETRPDRIVVPRPDGVTDVRLHRVTSGYGCGWGMWIKPQKHDYESPGVCVEAVDYTASECGQKTGEFVFYRDNTEGDLRVSFEQTGTASPDDYEEGQINAITIPDGTNAFRFTITPCDDDLSEGPESVKLNLLPGDGYSIGTIRQSKRDRVMIGDSDTRQTVFITGVDTIADEDRSLHAEGNAIISFERTAPHCDLRIHYTLGGTAAPEEYEENLSGEITIPDGKYSADLNITMVNDTDKEDEQTLIITALANDKYKVRDPKSVEIKMIDDDPVVYSVQSIAGDLPQFLVKRNSFGDAQPFDYTLSGPDGDVFGKALIPPGKQDVVVDLPEGAVRGKWTLSIDPQFESNQSVLKIPDSVSRYWWIVSSDRIAAIDLHNSDWNNKRNKPGAPVVDRFLDVPEIIQQDPLWRMPCDVDYPATVAYDSIDDILWIFIGFRESENPFFFPVIWQVKNVSSKDAKFTKWAVGKKACYRVMGLSLGSDRNLYARGKCPPFRVVLRTRTSLPKLLVSSKAKENKIPNPFMAVPSLVGKMCGLENAEIEEFSCPGVKFLDCQGKSTILGNLNVPAVCGWWDPLGRLWVRPAKWAEDIQILDPRESFRVVQRIKRIGEWDQVTFDNEYAYASGHRRNAVITRVPITGGDYEYLECRDDDPESLGNYIMYSHGDPTGYNWFRLTQENAPPSATVVVP